MKKYISMITAILFVLIAGISSNVYAITLGFPDINYDSKAGNGANIFGAQGVSFDSLTGYLTVSAQAVSITDGINFVDISGTGTVDYRVKFLPPSSALPDVVTGNFVTDGVVGDDLIVKGSAPGDPALLLLTGDFISYRIDGTIGSTRGSGEAIFKATGGFLSPAFVPFGGMVNLYFNVDTIFLANTFDGNFSGDIDGDLAPVPEPGTILLLGSGILGLVFIGRKKY